MYKKQERYSFYKELYFKELERKEQISTRIQWIISFWVLLMGAIIYSLNNMYKIPESFHIFYYIILCCVILILIRATVYILQCLWGRKILYLPDPQASELRFKDLEVHYKDYPGEAQKQFEKETDELLVEILKSNIEVNDVVITKITKAIQHMIISTIFLLFSFIFLLPDFIKAEEPTSKIEIINHKEIQDIEYILNEEELEGLEYIIIRQISD